MRSCGVVMDSLSFDDGPGMGQVDEPFFVQIFIAEPSVEAFDEGVLRRLPGFNEVQRNTVRLRPFEHRLRGQFGTVVHDQALGQTPELGQVIEEAGEPFAGDRQIDELTGTSPAVVVDDVEDAEPAPRGELVGDEVQRPAPQRPIWNRQWQAIAPRQSVAPAPSHPQLLLAIEPVGPLGVYYQAFLSQQQMQAQIAVTPVARRQLLQPGP